MQSSLFPFLTSLSKRLISSHSSSCARSCRCLRGCSSPTFLLSFGRPAPGLIPPQFFCRHYCCLLKMLVKFYKRSPPEVINVISHWQPNSSAIARIGIRLRIVAIFVWLFSFIRLLQWHALFRLNFKHKKPPAFIQAVISTLFAF